MAAIRLRSEDDARRIVERASGYDGVEYFLNADGPVSERNAAHYHAMLERRAGGEPLQYVLGRWGFRTLDLMVDRRVLIPRPETEMVVEVAIAEARRLDADPLAVLDLGTGSGAIALSLAAELPGAEVWATDASPDALAVARANLAGLGGAAARVRLLEGSWFDALDESLAATFDVIVSNPPYVAESDELPDEVRDWEPAMALVSGPTGLEAIVDILVDAPRWLTRPGVLVLELAPHQASQAARQARELGYDDVSVHKDLVGRDRVLVARVQ